MTTNASDDPILLNNRHETAAHRVVLDETGAQASFQIALSAGETYRIDAAGLRETWISEILGPDGTLLHDGTATDTQVGTDAQLTFTAPESGDYTITAGLTPGTNPRKGAEAMLFQILSSQQAADDHVAGPIGATEITVGEAVLGSADFDTDADWFLVYLEAGVTYQATQSGSARGGGTLEIGNLLFFTAADDIRDNQFTLATYTQQTRFITPEASGYYHIRASGQRDETGTYTLIVEEVTDQVGDTPETATPLTLGQSVSGAIESRDDVDMYSIELAGGQIYYYDVGAVVGNESPFETADPLGVWSENGLPVASGGRLDGTYSFWAPTTGTYYFGLGEGRNEYDFIVWSQTEVTDPWTEAPLETLDSTVTGVSRVGSPAYHRITASAGTVVTLLADVAVEYSIRAQDGTEVEVIDSPLTDDVSFVAPTDGDYLLQLDFGHTANTGYLGDDVAPTYRLQIRDETADPGYAASNALQLDLNETATFSVTEDNRSVFLELDLPDYAWYSIAISPTGTMDGQAHVYVRTEEESQWDYTRLVEATPEGYLIGALSAGYKAIELAFSDYVGEFDVLIAKSASDLTPLAEATPVVLGQEMALLPTVEGGDRAYFSLDMEAGKTYHIGSSEPDKWSDAQFLTAIDGDTQGEDVREESRSDTYAATQDGTYLFRHIRLNLLGDGATITVTEVADDLPHAPHDGPAAVAGQDYIGRLDYDYDVDFVPVELENHAIYRVIATHADHDRRIFNNFYDENYRRLAVDEVFSVGQSGRYYAQIGSYIAGDYTFQLEQVEESESAVDTLDANGQGTGTFEIESDLDFWQFEVEAGATYGISFSGDESGENLGLGTVRSLTDSNGTVIDLDDPDWGFAWNYGATSGSFVAPESTTLTMGVKSYAWWRTGAPHDYAIDVVRVEEAGDLPPYYAEPLTVGVPHSDNTTKLFGTVNYVFEGQANHVYAVEIKGQNSGNGTLADPPAAKAYFVKLGGGINPRTSQARIEDHDGSTDSITYFRGVEGANYINVPRDTDDPDGSFTIEVTDLGKLDPDEFTLALNEQTLIDTNFGQVRPLFTFEMEAKQTYLLEIEGSAQFGTFINKNAEYYTIAEKSWSATHKTYEILAHVDAYFWRGVYFSSSGSELVEDLEVHATVTKLPEAPSTIDDPILVDFDTPITGALDSLYDADLYGIEVQAGNVYSIALDSFDHVLAAAFSPDDHLIYRATYTWAAPHSYGRINVQNFIHRSTDTGHEIVFLAQSDGVYSFSVENKPGKEGDGFTLSVTDQGAHVPETPMGILTDEVPVLVPKADHRLVRQLFELDVQPYQFFTVSGSNARSWGFGSDLRIFTEDQNPSLPGTLGINLDSDAPEVHYAGATAQALFAMMSNAQTRSSEAYITLDVLPGLWGTDAGDAMTAIDDGTEIQGYAGNDTITGSALSDLLNGGLDDDQIVGMGGADEILGEAGADVLDGRNGNDYLYGGTEDDLLIGWGGRDRLRGNAGDDTMIGDNKNDFLQGGTGADVFVFNLDNGAWGKDYIKDFELGVDRVQVEGFSADDVTWKVLKSGAGVMAIVKGGGKIVFNGHDLEDLTDLADWDFLG